MARTYGATSEAKEASEQAPCARQVYEQIVEQLQSEFEKSMDASERQIATLEQHNALLRDRQQQLATQLDALQHDLAQSRDEIQLKNQELASKDAQFREEMRTKQQQMDQLLQLVQKATLANHELHETRRQLQLLQQENECLKDLLVHNSAQPRQPQRQQQQQQREPDEEQEIFIDATTILEEEEEEEEDENQDESDLELKAQAPMAQQEQKDQKTTEILLLKPLRRDLHHPCRSHQSEQQQQSKQLGLHPQRRASGYRRSGGHMEELDSYAPTSPTSSVARTPPSTPLLRPNPCSSSGTQCHAPGAGTTAVITMAQDSPVHLDALRKQKLPPQVSKRSELLPIRSASSPTSSSSSSRASSSSTGAGRLTLSHKRRLDQEIQTLRAKFDACFMQMEQPESR